MFEYRGFNKLKILAIIGSHRKNGNSHSVIKKIEDKIKTLGKVDFEYVFLSDLELNLCKGCGICILKGEEYCSFNDDRKLIEEKILNVDGVIFISPVYAMNMTAMMKNLLDRFAYTMHRPRFFKQYTMIVAVTGSVGLKETIDSISAIKASGYNIVQTLGIVAPDALTNTEITDEKIIKTIDCEIERFYKILTDKKPMSPSFYNIVQFRVQQKIFDLLKDKLSCDNSYFKEKGWLNKKTRFYTANAKINPFFEIIAKILAWKIANSIK